MIDGMLAAGEGNAGGGAALFPDERSEGLAEGTLPGDSFLDQVIVFRLPGETRLSRATNVAMATRVATTARISRVRGCRAHFIFLIHPGPRLTPQSLRLLPRRNHVPDVLIPQHAIEVHQIAADNAIELFAQRRQL